MPDGPDELVELERRRAAQPSYRSVTTKLTHTLLWDEGLGMTVAFASVEQAREELPATGDGSL